ncbi:DUF4190 domain-containing protein [Subtercola endophyticus]|uniref:DUF4190 domain-containing protein n=1 Tax=Subtercola endophyticus TaxID=2895559 RepID=UPI001E4FC557|nr:DUF4190 domain-containing protein [Subtercola endophyticus]UFS59368.1 DUF4190 domain-containing protein [Subtercola endophyticus]
MTSPAPYGASTGPVAPRTNVLAIVSLVVSIVGFTIIGIILGFVALSQIKRTGESGRGLALAGIIIGFVELVLGIILFVVIIAIAANSATVTTY